MRVDGHRLALRDRRRQRPRAADPHGQVPGARREPGHRRRRIRARDAETARGSPRVIFTDPQVAAVGMTEAAAREAGLDVRTVSVADATARPARASSAATPAARRSSSSTPRAASSSARRSSASRSASGCRPRRSPSSARSRSTGCGTACRRFRHAARCGCGCWRPTRRAETPGCARLRATGRRVMPRLSQAGEQAVATASAAQTSAMRCGLNRVTSSVHSAARIGDTLSSVRQHGTAYRPRGQVRPRSGFRARSSSPARRAPDA